MEQSILKFADQFSYRPDIKNIDKLGLDSGQLINDKFKNFVLGGMGGSHLAAGILRAHDPSLNLYIHRDYGLPAYDDNFCNNSLFIASSYSGNTEEVVDFLDESYSRGYPVLVISVGGKLIDFAKENNLSYIQLPDAGIQPRLAVGYSTIALASIVSPGVLPELLSLEQNLNPEKFREEAVRLAQSLQNKIPVIYTSNQNRSIGYNWKIKLNETGKVPAFSNVFPELNHNEMQGYDFVDKNKNLSENFHFIIIQDAMDDDRVSKRMNVLESVFQEKGLDATRIFIEGATKFEKIFNALILADWISLYLSQYYGTEPEQVPLIEKFKKQI